MKRLLLSLFVCAACLSMAAQNDAVLITIDGKPVMASEFMYIYQKNNQESAVEKKSKEEYLEMFINFKLKVFEAEAAGMDTTQAFAQELKGYRAQATAKYMEDREAIDSLIQLSYSRMSRDRRAAHIAIECPTDAPDSAQQAALAKITAARKRVLNGEDFGTVAAEVSTIEGAQNDHGELGWVMPFRYVYAFEDAVYSTPVGQITEVFRSPYGFHFALVEEELPHLEVNASHIMKMVPKKNATLDSIAKANIDSLYTLLQNNANFAALAQRESDDKGSAMRGGNLGWFGRGLMVKPFEDAVYALHEGQMTEPFRSSFGWHIAVLNGRRLILPLDSLKAQIEKNIRRDERFKEADKAFIAKMRKEYHLSNAISDDSVRAYADSQLESKYEDFRHLVQEYHDGILLFDISLDKVWDRAAKDDEGLTNYFNTHKSEYTWDQPRWKGIVIYAQDALHAKAAKNMIKSANPDSIESYIQTRINSDGVQYVKIESGLWKKGQNMAVDELGFKVKGAKYQNDKKPIALLVGKKIKAPEDYKDERGKVTSDYQDELEQIWVAELRNKHRVIVNQQVFEQLP